MSRPYIHPRHIALATKDGRAIRQFDRDEGYDDFIRADGRSRLGDAPPVHLTIRNRTLLERFWRAAPDVLMTLILLNMIGLIVALAFDRPFAGSCFFIGMGVAAATLFARLWIGGTK